MSKQKPAPKPVQPIFNELNTKLWWEYKQYTIEEVDAVDKFLAQNQKEIHLNGNLDENLKQLYKMIEKLLRQDLLDEPLLIPEEPKNPKDKKQSITYIQEKSDTPDIEAFSILNQKIDLILLKLLNFCWPLSKLTSIKLNQNKLDDKVEDYFFEIISNSNVKLNKLFFDWNPLNNPQNYIKISLNSNLEFLSLRGNNITDEYLDLLCEGLKTNGTLKYLDLYDNKITSKGVSMISQLMKTDSGLEYLSIAKNKLFCWNDIKEFLNGIGRIPITQNQVDELKKLERERDSILTKNNKNKGKKGFVEEPVPFIDPFIQTPEGWFLLKGQKLQIINLGLNQFSTPDVEGFDQFLSRQPETFKLVLAGNLFESTDIELLIDRHHQKIII